MSLDRFDTPRDLADRLVALVECQAPAVVADFAAGSGVLLDAAVRRWPTATLLANDIRRPAVEAVRRVHPDWHLSVCDFTSARSRGASSTLSRFDGKVDVVLLNPPFTDRGGHARFGQCLAGAQIRASRAVAFVLAAVTRLSPTGEIAAILPAGVLTSQRDRTALGALRELGALRTEVVEGDASFRGCRLRVALVHFVLQAERGEPSELWSAPTRASAAVAVFRGQVSASLAEPGSLPLVHSTSLVGGRVAKPLLSSNRGNLHNRPLLLLPRVGTPRADKIAVWDGHALVLSDCVIAVAGLEADALHSLKERVVSEFEALSQLYTGSCARYLTLSAFADFLCDLGIAAAPQAATAAGAHWLHAAA